MNDAKDGEELRLHGLRCKSRLFPRSQYSGPIQLHALCSLLGVEATDCGELTEGSPVTYIKATLPPG